MKQKRMIYIYEENLDFYDSLDNKSEFINEALSKSQGVKEPQENTDPNWHPDPRIRETRAAVAAIDAKNRQ